MNDREEPETFLARQQHHATKEDPTRAGLTLAIASKMWPTPATRDYKGPNSAEHMDVSSGALHLDQLPNFVAHVWSTPKVSAGGYTRDKGKVGQERLTLDGEAKQWATPSVADTTGGRMSRSGDRSDEVLIKGQANFLSSRLDQTTLLDGEIISSSGRQLNPVFVEALMGWPPMSTMLFSIIGSTDCENWEMAWCLWRWRMRFALSHLALHDGPPAQLSLFIL